jgi:hypothetical protein
MGDTMRISRWLLAGLAIVGGLGAAFAFIVYAANGIVAGSLIGLTGREHDIAIAQHRSFSGLLSGVLLQFIIVGALFSSLEREDGHGMRNLFIAVLGACVVTTVCGFAIMLGVRALG